MAALLFAINTPQARPVKHVSPDLVIFPGQTVETRSILWTVNGETYVVEVENV
jgi:hypothetical protein